MGRKHKLHELGAENDIRYRGPLSYQGFQWLGWLCISLGTAYFLLNMAGRFSPAVQTKTADIRTVLEYISSLSLPFLLIANFAKILNHTDGYKSLLIKNGGAAAGFFLGSVLLGGRYVVELISSIVSDPENVVPTLEQLVRRFTPYGFVAYNIFIDLFLCTLFMYFLTARPKKIFTGKKLIIFRLFAIVPVANEIGAMILKGRSAVGLVELPLWSFPLLTVKPPMTFAVFMVLAIFIKTREMRFRKHGRTHEEYQAFLQTNRNSLHFSVFLSVSMLVAALIDLLILLYLTVAAAPSVEVLHVRENVMKFAAFSLAMGFGNAFVPLTIAAPFVMLFSYTRMPKNKKLSMLIPLFAIGLILVIVLEGAHLGAHLYGRNADKMTVQKLIETIQRFIPGRGGI